MAGGNITIANRVTVSGDVTLILMDGCHLTLSKGISVNGGNSLTICAQSTGNEMGRLEASGSTNNPGIGSDSLKNGGLVRIHGGSITATGGESGAGIGGGNAFSASQSVRSATVVIRGGSITATGGKNGAAIGGGDSEEGDITITGGTISATGDDNAAGIGGGQYKKANITISGNAVISKAYGGNAGGVSTGYIEGGYPDDKIKNDNRVPQTLNNGHGGAGIGGGAQAEGGTIVIGGNALLQEVIGGSSSDGSGGAGIGGGASGNGGSITITGGKIQKARGGYNGAGIGGGESGNGGTITITGGTVEAYGDPFYELQMGGGAGIGGGRGKDGGSITIGGKDTSVFAEGGRFAAGIGGGAYGSGGIITVDGGTVTGHGYQSIFYTYGVGTFGAGIGGGFYGESGTITINGGTVNGEGGQEGVYGDGEKGGAGIGAGYHGDVNSIAIHGGTVSALGGLYAAGIGGTNSKSIGTILIDGGTVNANGSPFGAGIGGGYCGTGGNITISGGTINAKGNVCGAGIGGGCKSSGGTIIITGGTISAEAGQRLSMFCGAAGIGAGGEEKRIHGRACGTITITGGTIVKAKGGENGFDGFLEDAGIGNSGNDGTITYGNVNLGWTRAADGGAPVEPKISPVVFNRPLVLDKDFSDQQDGTIFGAGEYTDPNALSGRTLVPFGVEHKINLAVTGGVVDPVLNFGEPKVVSQALVGDSITLRLAPHEGFLLTTLTLEGNGSSKPLTWTAGNSGYDEASFVMLDYDVTVRAVFVPDFSKVSFTIPAGTRAIKANAFKGATSITAVDASHCSSIGAEAFKNCTGLVWILLPKDCAIDKTAFTGCKALVAIYGTSGGTTEAWANANGILFVGIK